MVRHGRPRAGVPDGGRAELAALVWAAEAGGDGVEARSDCQYVVRGAWALAAGRAGPLLEGRNGDLWGRLVGRALNVRKVKAHRNVDEVLADGLVDWLANDLADSAAKGFARSLAVPGPLRQRRAEALAAVRATHRCPGAG